MHLLYFRGSGRVVGRGREVGIEVLGWREWGDGVVITREERVEFGREEVESFSLPEGFKSLFYEVGG